MSEQAFSRVVRLMMAIVAVSFWIVSVIFSVEGFGFSAPDYKWVGYVLAIGILVFELMFNERPQHATTLLTAVGVLAYIYGVITNILGLWLAQNKPDYIAHPMLASVAIIFSLVIEIAPAPAILFALDVPGRDFLHGVTGKPPKQKQQHYPPNMSPQMQMQSYVPKQFPMKGTVANKHGHP